MKREPARRIHQIRTFSAHVGQTLGRQRAAFRRLQRSAPANTQRYRFVCRNDFAEVDTHAWSKRADADGVLYKPGQLLAVLLDIFDFQRTVELENHRAGRVQRRKRNVRACAQQVLLGNNLSFNSVVSDIEPTGWLLGSRLLRLSREGERQNGQSRHEAREDRLDSFHDIRLLRTIIQPFQLVRGMCCDDLGWRERSCGWLKPSTDYTDYVP